MHAADLDKLRLEEVEPLGGKVICFSFESFGEGSDKDKSFAAGKYFEGPMYVVRKEVYAELFGRKGLFNSFFGLADMSKDKYEESKKRGITGNLAGDGMQLGGSFVVDTDGTVLLDHRQTFYGDDESNDGLLKAIKAAKGLEKK